MKTYDGPEPKKWVVNLIGRHIGRLKLDDAPEMGTEQYADAALIWDEAFQVVNASASEADKASRRVASNPTPWWREQLPALLKAIDLDRGSNFAQGPDGAAPVSDRESAMAASMSCEWCEGSGFVMVFHRQYQGSPELMIEQPDGTRRRVMGRFNLACQCEYGRWMLGRIRTADKPLADRLDGLEAVIEGRSRYVAGEPGRRETAQESPGSRPREFAAAY